MWTTPPFFDNHPGGVVVEIDGHGAVGETGDAARIGSGSG
jgi:hypothetical protein